MSLKVIICGAGEVGYNLAGYLSTEGNDVTVIDQSKELIKRVSESLDVAGIIGHASQPEVLENAGIRDCEIIIAVTQVDEINMVACQVAHSLFNVPTKIARIRSQSYLQPIWSQMFARNHLPIDVVISPEIEIAKSITRDLEIPGAMEVIPLSDDKIRLVGVRIENDTPLINTPLRQLTSLFPELDITVVGIKRGDTVIVPHSEDQMLPGDEAYFVIPSVQCKRAMAAFGHEEPETRRAVICGGGNIGLILAKELEKEHPEINIKIIESNLIRAQNISAELENSIVLNGNVLEPDILFEAGVEKSEVIITLTNDDETNILAALLGKKCGSQRAIALVNKSNYNTLMGPLGIDVVINPKAITVSQVLSYVRRGRIHSVHSIQENFGELIEADALDTSTIVGKPLKEIDLPSNTRFGAIMRNDQVIVPGPQTIIEGGDRVILFAAKEAVPKVERLFSVRLEYF